MKIIGAGLVAVDIVQLCDANWHPNNNHHIYVSGGTVCNILSYLAKFGWSCEILGSVGNDELAKVIVEDLNLSGVDTRGLLPHNLNLTRRIAHLIAKDSHNGSSHKFSLSCFSCHSKFPAIPPPQYQQLESLISRGINSKTVLIIDRANKFTLKLADDVCKQNGVVIFEPGYLSDRDETVLELISKANLIKYSEGLMWRDKPFSKFFLSGRHSKYPRLKLLIETRGSKGVKVIYGNREIKKTTTPVVSVLDSAGAGDAFTAGILTGIKRAGLFHLDKLAPEVLDASINRGQALGALACLFLTSKGLLYNKDREEIEAAIGETVLTYKPPKNFGSIRLPKGIRIPMSKASYTSICHVCRMPRSSREYK